MNGLWYGFWDEWLLYHKVVFDGVRKLILVNPGITNIDIKQDLYSDWKEWTRIYDYLKFQQAFRSVGGDPTTPGKFIGGSFFLLNGWQIQSWVGTHDLVLNGNLYVDGSGSAVRPYDLPPHTPTFVATITQERSNLSELIITSGSGGSSSGSFSNSDRQILQAIQGIVSNLPNSGSLSGITTAVDKIQATNIFAEGIVLNSTVDWIQTTLSGQVNNTYNNMTILVTSGSAAITRKVDTYDQAGGKFTFDVACGFVPAVSSSVFVIPGYEPRNGSVG